MLRPILRGKNKFSLPLSHFLVVLLALVGCSEEGSSAVKGDAPSTTPAVRVTATIDISRKFQRIDNFAASDAWSCQFVGNWPENKKNAIADLLFSTQLDANGQPKGIGLSLWRFNIGAGSSQQGEQSGIKDEWRRAESFLDNDGSYNWQRQAGQVWFLKAAQARGVSKFLAFPNSPTVNLTRNGKAFASNGTPNLAPARYEAFSDYLADVIQGVERVHGVTFNYISPVNEPQWDWSDGGQEGTPFMNAEVAGIVRALNTSLARRNLTTKIDIAEAGKIDYLYQEADKPNRGNQIDAFFSKNSPHYVADLPHVSKVISGHSYFTTSPAGQAVASRKQLASKVATVPGLEFWQSEYCILGDNAGEIDGNKRVLGIDPAIYLARVIHNDLVVANATAWQWWLAISPYNYKDGLIYIDQNKTDGNFYESKMLWALGNYSRFIRPGAERVDLQVAGDRKDENDALLASAYLDTQQKKLIMVAVNPSILPVQMNMEVKGATIRNIIPYVTSDKENLTPGSPLQGNKEITVAPRSVITFVADLQL
ncbi:glycoside hydrolase [Rufibacter sediminis]|uniref:Xylanase n=1 Tax=Rufibacter sediminis TaxID=2762756 RepID=A0ABR6VPM5_9BACT|nr:glycoside hydrolase [Rufibacter sediminis]MBC3539144.1 xylanase [Rufibacter sediminis]